MDERDYEKWDRLAGRFASHIQSFEVGSKRLWLEALRERDEARRAAREIMTWMEHPFEVQEWRQKYPWLVEEGLPDVVENARVSGE